MATVPIPAVGLRAFALLRKQYHADLVALGDEILTALGYAPDDPRLTVDFDAAVVTADSIGEVAAAIRIKPVRFEHNIRPVFFDEGRENFS